MLGERRDPVLPALLSFVTCGIWLHVWMYQTTEELRRHLVREDVNPGLDLVLGLVTCGLYYLYAIYRNTRMMLDASYRAGMRVDDRTALYIVLLLVFSPATVYLLQEDLNRLWATCAARANLPGPTAAG